MLATFAMLASITKFSTLAKWYRRRRVVMLIANIAEVLVSLLIGGIVKPSLENILPRKI